MRPQEKYRDVKLRTKIGETSGKYKGVKLRNKACEAVHVKDSVDYFVDLVRFFIIGKGVINFLAFFCVLQNVGTL